MALSDLFGWGKKKDEETAPATACGAADKPAEAPAACGAAEAPAACGAADK
ncbi:MAG: ACGX-repeat peptide [Ruminococcaceae bacterium]|nr:ACGX-repeat peptide [Oscillospiraceae bacterium]